MSPPARIRIRIFDTIRVHDTGQTITVDSSHSRCCDHTHVAGHEMNADGSEGQPVQVRIPDGGWTLIERQFA